MKSPKGNYKFATCRRLQDFVGVKPAALFSAFGGSITAMIDNVEYGTGYDITLFDKYTSHQGSLKIKLKF